MSVIQGTGTSIYLAAHMKEQARCLVPASGGSDLR